MRRWLVALALAVVVMPDAATAAAELRVDLATRTVTSTTTAPAKHTCIARPHGLPGNVEIGLDGIRVAASGMTFRHRIDELRWSVAVGNLLVVGHASTANFGADRITGIDHTSGRIAWKRKVDSLFAAELVGNLVAVERAGALDVIDARTGKTVDTTQLAGQGIHEICRTVGGDLHLKTTADLIAIERSGHIRWTQPTTARGNVAITARAVVDGWVDRENHRYGIVTYDPATGRKLESIDLGATGGWYDVERVELAPDGAGEVLVSSMFGVA